MLLWHLRLANILNSFISIVLHKNLLGHNVKFSELSSQKELQAALTIPPSPPNLSPLFSDT